jgi:hypothetical protein
MKRKVEEEKKEEDFQSEMQLTSSPEAGPHFSYACPAEPLLLQLLSEIHVARITCAIELNSNEK